MSTHPLWRKDNSPMCSKIIIVLAVLVVAPFTYMSTADALNIKHHRQQETQHIQSLHTEYHKLNTQLDKTKAVKQTTQAQVDQLEQQAQDAASERQKLESELGAN